MCTGTCTLQLAGKPTPSWWWSKITEWVRSWIASTYGRPSLLEAAAERMSCAQILCTVSKTAPLASSARRNVSDAVNSIMSTLSQVL